MVPFLFVETAIGYLSPLSPSQRRNARPSCFRLLTQLMRFDLRLAEASAGRSMAAKMAMTAMMMSNPTRVKPCLVKYRNVEFMPETMILPPLLSSHSSARLMHKCVGATLHHHHFSPSPPPREERGGVRRSIVSKFKSPLPGPLPALAGRGSWWWCQVAPRCVSKTFSALPFPKSCLAWAGSGLPQCKHTFCHEKKSLVHLRTSTGPARHPQLRLRQKRKSVRHATKAGHRANRARLRLGGEDQLHRGHLPTRCRRQFLFVSRDRAMAGRSFNEGVRLAAGFRVHAGTQSG